MCFLLMMYFGDDDADDAWVSSFQGGRNTPNPPRRTRAPLRRGQWRALALAAR